MSHRLHQLAVSVLLILLCASFQTDRVDDRFLTITVDPQQDELRMFWKDEQGVIYKNFYTLRDKLAEEGQELTFAMNGGMFREDYSPLGLYVGEYEVKHRLNQVQEAYGNFYLQPNGVFLIDGDNRGHIVKTADFEMSNDVCYATQSGPMLLIEGAMHPAITEGSTNLHVRNGVGVMPDGRLLFAMSTERVNFWDMATMFKQAGCRNALYLDGAVSRTYLPSGGYTDNGLDFGVMIGVIQPR